ncbi:unnamed protein product [Soboliphyme baturini]|uniref:PNPLA domain-containing protein n=1 Tax=Soboliphyme baturini TaxID=241478 RepID=A0A183JA42_9BILA|nr:unnamed protein product [Soboliphyme baturini]
MAPLVLWLFCIFFLFHAQKIRINALRHVLRFEHTNKLFMNVECLGHLYEVAAEVRQLNLGLLTPNYSLMARLQQLIEQTLPDDAHQRATDKLFVSVTNLTRKHNVLASSFTSRSELIRVTLKSYLFISFTSILSVNLHFVDGGLTCNLPKFHDTRTITVSPFRGDMSVRNLMNGARALFPPETSVLEQYYALGYSDTMRFLINNNLFAKLDKTCE